MDPTQELPLATESDFEEIPVEEAAEPVEPDLPEAFHETREGRLLSQLIDDLERPDNSIRQQMVMVWRKMDNYWRDRQYIIWDEIAGDWRTPEEIRQMDNKLDIDPASYAKIINIYKAHGEAIISALSSGLPYVRFFPDDADVPEDLFTAKSYSKISELIQKRNKGQLLFIRALFLLYNCGTVFAYNENKDTTQFGTHRKKQYQDVPVINRQHFCPSCGAMMGSDQFDAPEPTDEVAGSVQSANTLPPAQPTQCPQCGEVVQPDSEDFEEIIPRLVGETEEPKTHEFIEVFSGQHVKIPHWVRTQAQTPYLTLETEEHYALLRDIYPEIAGKIIPNTTSETFDAQSRTNQDYRGDTPQDLTTLKRSWIRPWAFNAFLKPNPSIQGTGMEGEGLDDAAYLKSLYPEGVYISKVGDIIAEAVPDKLDDHWTISVNPLSNFLHADPLAQPLVPVQDITNELTNLTLETVEFGIPETFYDSETIDSEQYGKSEARPGMLYPAKARPTMGLDSSFHTVKTATLSQEVDNFANRITDAGQLVVGAQPTIWGGALEGAGGTAREVEQSKASALQRLNLTWTMLKMWWADVMSKSVRSFAVNMKDDEKYVQSKGSTFVNIWIRRAEMTGKVGSIEPDVNEAFPISWAQKRDILMNMIGLKNPMVDAVLAHPENAGTIASVIGFPELYIPGDDTRNKQLYEISQLIMAQPMPTGQPGPDGQEVLIPSIEVEEWEPHQVAAETCKAWLQSDVGIDCKQNNPAGYMNVVAHMQMHEMKAQAQMAAEAAAQGEENGSESSESSGDSGEAPGSGRE